MREIQYDPYAYYIDAREKKRGQGKGKGPERETSTATIHYGGFGWHHRTLVSYLRLVDVSPPGIVFLRKKTRNRPEASAAFVYLYAIKCQVRSGSLLSLVPQVREFASVQVVCVPICTIVQVTVARSKSTSTNQVT